LTGKVFDGYSERILQGLQHWIDAGRNGYLAWGLLHFRKPLYASEQSAEDEPEIRVVIVDDHDMIRNALRSLLEEEQGFVIVGEAKDGAQALEVVPKLAPDVVSMGYSMPVMDGVLATKALMREGCVSRILGLAMREDLQTVASFLEAGAAGFVSKTEVSPDAFFDGIRAVNKGLRWLGPSIRENVLEELDECFAATARNESTSRVLVFAEREKRVIRMVVDCCNAAEIASELGISQKKLSILKAGIAEKLDSEKRAEAEDNPCKAAENSLIILRRLLLAEQA
jgi:DNA-binding NarL/FixJ family response regulator